MLLNQGLNKTEEILKISFYQHILHEAYLSKYLGAMMVFSDLSFTQLNKFLSDFLTNIK